MQCNSLVATLLMVFTGTAAATEPLPKLNLEREISVSGISSGGYMANQFHLAHAEMVSGVGIIAGGPYDCADGSLGTALQRCVGKADANLDVGKLVARAQQRASVSLLAKPDEWSRAKVWLFHGSKDSTVARGVADQLAQFYRAIVPTTQLHYVTDIPAAHAVPTVANGNACDRAESPFINACAYDAAGELLSFLLGKLNAKAETSSGKLMQFDQEIYAPDGDSTLADEGFLYVPKSCEAGAPCKLHIAFHGCQQNESAIGERFVREAGYNNWADSNQLVILYPQTQSSMLPLNPKGCWDWWGYTGTNYATRAGNQIETVAAMVNAMRR